MTALLAFSELATVSRPSHSGSQMEDLGWPPQQLFQRNQGETEGAVKRQLLLHFVGKEIYKLFEHLPGTGGDDGYSSLECTP